MQDLLGFANGIGFSIPNIQLDGNVHRLNRNGKKNAWYVGWATNKFNGDGQFITAVFGDWKTDEKHEFKNSVKLSRDESEFHKKRVAEAMKKAEAERATMRDEAAKKARDLYASGSKKVTAIPYLEKKKITQLFGAVSQLEEPSYNNPSGGRVLYIPMQDVENVVTGLQRIYENGDKRFITGQQNHGNFALVGTIQENDTTYLCEGWATGATIHMATGKSAICAMSAGNILAVARNVKKKYPGLNIVICGDADEVGKVKARETADAIQASCLIPECKNGGTDFNDVYCDAGLDAVKSQLLLIKKDDSSSATTVANRSGFIALGHSANNEAYYFFKQATNTIIQIRYFSDNDFLKLQSSQLWELQFPSSKSGFSKKEATDYLISISERAGIYRPEKIRAPGVWRDKKEVIYNTGRGIYTTKLELIDQYRGLFVYTNAHFGYQQPVNNPLTDDESFRLIRACEGFRWRDPNAGMLLAGWLALARCAGALPRRYHVWLTGPSDTGKTEAMEKIVRFSLGETGHAYFKGSSTEAGVRQEVSGSTRPVVFDELESDGAHSIERVTSIIELLRIAFDGGKVTKGSPSGVTHEFMACFPAIVSSIRMALDNDADRSRFMQIELQPLLKNQAERTEHYNRLLKFIADLHATEDFADRLFIRTLKNIENIIANSNKLKIAFSSRCQKSRTVNLYAILAAGHYSLITTGIMPDGAVEDYASGLDFGEEPVTDEELCLQHVLSMKVQVIDSRARGAHDQIVYERPSVAELTNKVADGKELSYDQEVALERDGFKISKDNLYISKNSPIIKAHCSRTKWAKSFGDVLSRVGEPSRLRFHGTRTPVVSIPLSRFTS